MKFNFPLNIIIENKLDVVTFKHCLFICLMDKFNKLGQTKKTFWNLFVMVLAQFKEYIIRHFGANTL
uniref:Uncharacterized protein n=1 Tax=Cryptosporidium parvum TaxID=5807 RepID=F0X4P7_CRYPV